jgi:hypothetical protein
MQGIALRLMILLSAIGVGGCLYLSLGMGLVACPLCIYQRSFIMAVFAVALVGFLAASDRPGITSLLALPLAVAGLGVAGYHESLIMNGTIECPAGVFGIGSLPTQSFVLFLCLSVLAMVGAVKSGTEEGEAAAPKPRPILAVVAIVVGVLLAVGSVVGAPPIPVRKTPYDPAKDVFNNCRPVYKPATESTS